MTDPLKENAFVVLDSVVTRYCTCDPDVGFICNPCQARSWVRDLWHRYKSICDLDNELEAQLSVAVEALEKAKGNASTSGVEFIETELAKIRKMGGSND